MAAVIGKVIIAGLDPAIRHVKWLSEFWMDARVKPAHDNPGLRSGR
jgi:hypothetical protein